MALSLPDTMADVEDMRDNPCEWTRQGGGLWKWEAYVCCCWWFDHVSAFRKIFVEFLLYLILFSSLFHTSISQPKRFIADHSDHGCHPIRFRSFCGRCAEPPASYVLGLCEGQQGRTVEADGGIYAESWTALLFPVTITTRPCHLSFDSSSDFSIYFFIPILAAN